MPSDHERRQIIAWIRAEAGRLSGRQYRIDFEALDTASLRALQHLFRDVETEHQQALARARLTPWRRG